MAKQLCSGVGMMRWEEDNTAVLGDRSLYSEPLKIYDLVGFKDLSASIAYSFHI